MELMQLEQKSQILIRVMNQLVKDRVSVIESNITLSMSFRIALEDSYIDLQLLIRSDGN